MPTTQELRAAARALVLETVREYYDETDTEIPKARSIAEAGGYCAYSASTGQHCAIGRLAPDAPWEEQERCLTGRNRDITIAAMRNRLGAPEGAHVDIWLGRVALQLQCIHDSPACMEHYRKIALEICDEVEL